MKSKNTLKKFQSKTIGSCTLYLADCLDVMPLLGDVDHVIMDGPYEEIMHNSKTGGAIRNDGQKSPEGLDFGPIDGIRSDVCLHGAALSNGWFISFCTPEGIAAWRDEIEAAGMRYKRACTWHKPDGTPQFNGQGPAAHVENFVTAWAGKGHSRWNGGGKGNVFVHPTRNRDRHGEHPTEKPLSLMQEIILKFTNQGDAVLDPFMGSGTTGVACARMQRNFIGIEKSEKWFEIACERIEAAVNQGDLFHTPKKIIQEKLF